MNAKFQIVFGVGLLAHLLSYLIAGGFRGTYAIVFLMLFGVLMTVAWTSLKIVTRTASSSDIMRQMRDSEQEIAALSIEEAKRRAELLLADPQR